MLRRSVRLVGVALAIFALAACQVSIGPIPFDPVVSGSFTAQVATGPTALRSNVQIAQGETLFFRIDMPGTVRDLLYAEAEGSDLRVGWLSTSGATLAVSESPAYFAGSVSAAASEAIGVGAGATIAPRAIDVAYVCVGPCAAIAPKTTGYYYLAVRNLSGGPRSFDLFAYTFDANDLEDRGAASNDTLATATPFEPGTFEQGAIELVGDRDWFEYVGLSERVLTFQVFEGAVDTGLRLRFEGDDQGVFDLTGLPGDQTTNLYPGDRFQVFSTLGRAGPAGTAGYVIQND